MANEIRHQQRRDPVSRPLPEAGRLADRQARVPSASFCCFVAYPSIVGLQRHRPAHSSEGAVTYSTNCETGHQPFAQ